MDTGAQITCAGMGLIRSLGLTRKDLLPVSLTLNSASNTSMSVLGAVFLHIRGKQPNGEYLESWQLCYIARGLKVMYLSHDACLHLKIVLKGFPTVGDSASLKSVG